MRESPEHPDRPGYNRGGVLVELSDGAQTSLFARVAWSRWRSKNPFRTFKGQLRRALARAEAEAERLNGA
jgi:hypothetical protein